MKKAIKYIYKGNPFYVFLKKHLKIKYHSILLIVLLLALSSCQKNEKKQYAESETVNYTEFENVTKNKADNEYLVEQTSENAVCIKVPVYDKKTNDLIAKTIEDYFVKNFGLNLTLNLSNGQFIDVYEFNYTDYLIDVDYRSSCITNDIHSIVFSGSCNYKKAAHPAKVLFSINFNPQNGNIIYFEDLYTVSEEMYGVFVEFSVESISKMSANGEYPNQWGDFSTSICTWQNFYEGIERENIIVFYKENSVVFAYPTSYSAGSFFETEIPYSSIEKFKK